MHTIRVTLVGFTPNQVEMKYPYNKEAAIEHAYLLYEANPSFERVEVFSKSGRLVHIECHREFVEQL